MMSRREWLALRAWAATGESPDADVEVRVLVAAVAEIARHRLYKRHMAEMGDLCQ